MGEGKARGVHIDAKFVSAVHRPLSLFPTGSGPHHSGDGGHLGSRWPQPNQGENICNAW